MVIHHFCPIYHCDIYCQGVHRVGTVIGLDRDGDLKVDFGENTWTLNPEVCKMVKSAALAASLPSQTSTTKQLNKQPDAGIYIYIYPNKTAGVYTMFTVLKIAHRPM